jgi:hypothetical protein
MILTIGKARISHQTMVDTVEQRYQSFDRQRRDAERRRADQEDDNETLKALEEAQRQLMAASQNNPVKPGHHSLAPLKVID